MTALAEQRVAIRRVRIRSPGGDALRVRLGVDRVLGAADLRPRSLPPAAILVVRSLADPLPGRLDTTAAVAAPDWQRAVGDALDGLLRVAARPGGGVFSPDAPAVLFADRSELLACLARDWCEAKLLERWWWPALGISAPPDVVAAFAETPEAVPAAFERLLSTSVLLPFAARLPPAVAAALTRAVASVLGAAAAAEAALEDVAGPPTQFGIDEEIPVQAPGLVSRTPATEPDSTPVRGAAAAAPWQKLLPVSLQPLAPEQEALVGVAIALRVAPSEVRSPRFVAAVRAWRAAVASGRPGADFPAAIPETFPPAKPAEPVPTARPVDRARAPISSPREPRLPEPKPAESGREESPAAGPIPPEPSAQPGARDERPDAAPKQEPEPVEEAETVVETRLGGVFHLVLVGQALGLYGDFTTPAEPGIRLDVWDFVTLLGRRLLRRPPRDPVWALLADLAGRDPGARPGRGFRPPRRRAPPRSWREPFEAAGVDLERELARQRQATGTTELDRWLDELAAYVRARLALALGVSAGRAVRLTIRRPASVLVSPTRVDVVSRLADLPIEVRVAGLDRDPGYVPASGRSLYFHFE